ncbi:biotin/lipoyl-containing protein, partial [Actinomadura latina]|uniref:biotin/lipoyl-containing protein n=1 Tax=Actinomadura latina TaxID=163603 RepID=UPI002897B288
MPVSVTMPQLGESVTEGTVTRWLKKEGERVETDEPLLEVSTDKVDTEIPSPASGILTSITVAEDEPRHRDRRGQLRQLRVGRVAHLRVGLRAEVLDDHLLDRPV